MDDNIEKIITQDELSNYMESLYEVTTVVPLIDNPYITSRIMNQQDLNEFIININVIDEFLINVRKLNN